MTQSTTTTQQKTLHYIAGLPRSGSTLLSSLLNQNPRFYSGPSSPVVGIMLKLQMELANDELYRAFPKPQQAIELVASVASHYYNDTDKPVIFDKNRSWTNNFGMITGFLNNNPKILCPVRDVEEILTSFITMHRRNPYEVNGRINFMDEMLIKSNIPLTDDNRCQFLAGPNGILGQSYEGMRQLIMEGKQRYMHFIEYTDLITNPQETMRKIYDFLEEPYFEHDFENITNVHRENDAATYGLADMHEVRNRLDKTSADPSTILSPEVLLACENSAFWRELTPYTPENTEDQESVTTSNVKGGFFDGVGSDSGTTNIIGG
jgi:sulfotransferase